jgi:hypothetical protein
MKKSISKINVNIIIDTENHKRSPYSLDGIHWMNGGELAEVLDKLSKGYKPEKDANGKWDETSDIIETRTSCKSYRFGLNNEYLGNTYEEVKTEYFKRVHSISWDYIIVDGDTLIVYTMDKTEFAEYLDNFHIFERGRIRGVRSKKAIAEMIEWLDARA